MSIFLWKLSYSIAKLQKIINANSNMLTSPILTSSHIVSLLGYEPIPPLDSEGVTAAQDFMQELLQLRIAIIENRQNDASRIHAEIFGMGEQRLKLLEEYIQWFKSKSCEHEAQADTWIMDWRIANQALLVSPTEEEGQRVFVSFLIRQYYILSMKRINLTYQSIVNPSTLETLEKIIQEISKQLNLINFQKFDVDTLENRIGKILLLLNPLKQSTDVYIKSIITNFEKHLAEQQLLLNDAKDTGKEKKDKEAQDLVVKTLVGQPQNNAATFKSPLAILLDGKTSPSLSDSVSSARDSLASSHSSLLEPTDHIDHIPIIAVIAAGEAVAPQKYSAQKMQSKK